MIALGIIAILVILIGFALASSTIDTEKTINNVEVEPTSQIIDEESTEKVVVEDFKDTLSNEDFVKKEPQTERVITEHIKSVIDTASKPAKKGTKRQRTRAVKK